jgi:hypothetical protein
MQHLTSCSSMTSATQYIIAGHKAILNIAELAALALLPQAINP